MIQKSQIVLFAGDFVPFGFAKCDGKNGTPNLPPLVYNKDADPLPYLIATDNVDDYYVGMILLTGFNQSSYNFPPMDWLPCDGRLLELTKHIVLFQILKTTFGGEGMQFALPNIAVAKATSDYNAAPYIICTQGPFPSPSQLIAFARIVGGFSTACFMVRRTDPLSIKPLSNTDAKPKCDKGGIIF